MALVTLKVVDANLNRVETILKAAECDTAMTVSEYVKIFHDTTNILRLYANLNSPPPISPSQPLHHTLEAGSLHQ